MKLDFLNQSQKDAVTFKDDPLMVIAGAGSGKTLVLTYRVANLIEKGFLPDNLFVTTFTVKAADEMIERLKPIIGDMNADSLRIGTFHSLCLKIYKNILDHLDFDYPLVIKQGSRFMTMIGIINSYKKEYGLNRFRTKDAKYLLKKISEFKNEGLTVDDIEKKLEGKIKIENEGKECEKFTMEYTEYLAYKDYENKLKERNLIDFDDMLLKTYLLLNDPKNDKILKSERRKISHILVDEAQDLNRIQHLLIEILAGKNKKLTLILDDWQTLYGFRGAKVKYIFEFKKKYNAHLIKLEQNYRSTKRIVDYGNKLILNNEEQIKKKLFTSNKVGDHARLFINDSVESEASQIVNEILNLEEKDIDLRDIAILYRTNAQSRAIVDELIINEIPHKVYSKEKFYDRPEIKDILSYIRILINPDNAGMDDYKRIINKPKRFIGATFINKVEDFQLDNGLETFWDALLKVHLIDLKEYQLNSAQIFVNQIIRLNKIINDKKFTTSMIIECILNEIGYQAYVTKENSFSEDEPDNDTGMNIDSLLVGAGRNPLPDDFLTHIDLLKDFEEDTDEEYLHVMTVHKSKGMEFPYVFVIGMSDKVMPHFRANDKEEERRIAYVAITRAKEQLYLSAIRGKFNRLNVKLSPFIFETGVKVPDTIEGKKVDLKLESIKSFEDERLTVEQQTDAIKRILGKKK